MAEFGERLKTLRTWRGWGRPELAQRSGVDYMTVYRLEEGPQKEPGVSIAARLAQALGVSLDVLAGLRQDDGDESKPLPCSPTLPA